MSRHWVPAAIIIICSSSSSNGYVSFVNPTIACRNACRRRILPVVAATSHDDGIEQKDLIELYKSVAEKDSEWFNEVIVSLLGEEDGLVRAVRKNEKNKNGAKRSISDSEVGTLFSFKPESSPLASLQLDNISELLMASTEQSKIKLNADANESEIEQENRTRAVLMKQQNFTAKKAVNSDLNTRELSDVDPIAEHSEASLEIADAQELNATVKSNSSVELSDVDPVAEHSEASLEVTDAQELNATVKSNSSVELSGVDPIAEHLEASLEVTDAQKLNATVKSINSVTLNVTNPVAESISKNSTSNEITQVEQVTVETDATVLRDIPSLNGEESNEEAAVPERKPDLRESRNPREPTIPSGKNVVEDDRVVAWKVAGFSFTKTPLVSMLRLGYNEAEVKSLQADALDLVFKNRIEKPQAGIPRRWCVEGASNKDVIVVSSNEGSEIIQQLLHKVSNRKEPNVGDDFTVESQADSTPTDRSFGNSSRGAVANSTASSTPPVPRKSPMDSTSKFSPPQRERRKGDDIKEESQPYRDSGVSLSNGSYAEERKVSRRRQTGGPRRSSKRGGKNRTIYSGRPAKRELDDPPEVKGPWPSITTFRSLLRDEASLRLRILGDSWEETVRQEADWRLDLYKNWLWALHQGVGDPIIESRSDRARRTRPTGRKKRDTKEIR